MKNITIISPVYKEEDVIEAFHHQLTQVLATCAAYLFNIVYVLDKSPDTTEALLEKIVARSKNVTVLVMSRRFGQQAALVAGMQAATGDAVIMLDSDLQHPPSLIPQILALYEEGADIVQTIRIDHPNIHFLKKASSHLFYKVLGKIANIDLQQGAADYRLLSAKVNALFKERLEERNLFVKGLVSWVGFHVRFISFEADDRKAGTSKYNVARLMNLAITGICSFSKAPLRWCSILGLIFAGVSFLIILYAFYVYFTGKAGAAPGWASLFCAIFFIGGVQLLFLGILGEYISLIFDEVKKRPAYIIDKILS